MSHCLTARDFGSFTYLPIYIYTSRLLYFAISYALNILLYNILSSLSLTPTIFFYHPRPSPSSQWVPFHCPSTRYSYTLYHQAYSHTAGCASIYIADNYRPYHHLVRAAQAQSGTRQDVQRSVPLRDLLGSNPILPNSRWDTCYRITHPARTHRELVPVTTTSRLSLTLLLSSNSYEEHEIQASWRSVCTCYMPTTRPSRRRWWRGRFDRRAKVRACG